MTSPPSLWAVLVVVGLPLVAGCKGSTSSQPSGPSPEELDALRKECSRIMPKTFAEVWVGMAEEDLKTERPDAKFRAQRTDHLERRWYNEMSPAGVSVWYGVDRTTERLAVIQFAHRFVTWDTFRSHAVALQDRFGTEYELYTCPSADPHQAAMTRLLWPRQPVAVMEAILEMSDSIAVTMIVSPVGDLRSSIEKQKCVRVDRARAMEHWLEQKVKEEQEELRMEAEEAHSHGASHGVMPPIDEDPEQQPSGKIED